MNKIKTESSSKSNSLFSKEEDNTIKHLYENIGIRDWKEISHQLPSKTSKNCQNRYLNYLQPNLKTDNWSKEEDDHLLNLVESYGGKWIIISKHLPGRSPLSVENRFVKYLQKNIKKNIFFPIVNKCRTAQLAFLPNDEEKEKIENQINIEVEKLFERASQNEFNAFHIAFDDF
jgi:hypothetical protein